MLELGYALSSEEHSPNDLVNFAQHAEATGFGFAMISDHFHPWTNEQPHSSFVWTVIGAISQTVRRIRLGTGVTCPLMRYHPALIAQAASTAATMMSGRFMLGVGTGENLNEHILDGRWPPPQQRLEMLEEAIAMMRLLWRGGWQSHHGKHYAVEKARIFTLPEQPPAILVAASKPRAAELAGRIADGLISTAPTADLIKRFEKAGGKDKPCYGQLTVCYASSENEAARAVRKYWPNAGVNAPLMTDLPTPYHFEQVVKAMRPEKITEDLVLGPDPRAHINAIQKFVDAGFVHVYVHQVGPNQQDFFRFYQEQVLPHFDASVKSANGSKGIKAKPNDSARGGRRGKSLGGSQTRA